MEFCLKTLVKKVFKFPLKKATILAIQRKLCNFDILNQVGLVGFDLDSDNRSFISLNS